jgi:AraC-like DNA-binding protein
MDALTALLEGPRASGAFLLRIRMNPPWSIRIQDESPLALMAVVSGDGHVVPDDADAVRMRSGDVGVLLGPEPYTVSGDPATPPQIIIHPGQRCTTLDGTELYEDMALGVRTWGNDPQGSVTILVGVYEEVGAVGKRLLDALPDRLVMPHDAWDSSLVTVLGHEISRDVPGQEVVLDRLLDLLLISVLRAWFDRPEAEAPAWYRANGDPVVGPALRLLHENPAHPWSVADLADKVGISRAGLARTFADLVGVPPMTYLTEWRLALAADLLREPHTTLDAVARKVGYSNGFALSTAFKRVRGVSPREYRATAS